MQRKRAPSNCKSSTDLSMMRGEDGPDSAVKRYLFIFGYADAETERMNDRHGWDIEFSEAVWIEASTPEAALAWGREIADDFVRRLGEAEAWSAGAYAHWIESEPERRYRPEVLRELPVVSCGELPTWPRPPA